jgi:hypothetical protein
MDLSSWPFPLSLSQVKKGFSLGNLKKSSKSITAVRQATWENSGTGQGLILDCQCYVGRARLQCTKAFIPPLKFSLFLFQDLTHLGRGPKTAGGKDSFSSSYKGVLSRAVSVSPEGWRCNFLTCPEAPKVAKSQTPPAMSRANRQSDLLCFLHGFCWQ